MSKRATDVIGKPVVDASSGDKLGTVTDLLLDDSSVSLIGLVVRRGMLKGEHVLPIGAVQTLGTDAVVSRTNELVGAKQWRLLQQQRAAVAGAPLAPADLQDDDEATLP